jgi:hypothetical protein
VLSRLPGGFTQNPEIIHQRHALTPYDRLRVVQPVQSAKARGPLLPRVSAAGRVRGCGTHPRPCSRTNWPTAAGLTGNSGASTAGMSGRMGSPRAREEIPHGAPADHAPGRSRSGCTTRLQIVTDATGCRRPQRSARGQAHESVPATLVLDVVRVPRRRPGSPRQRHTALAGDKGYSYPAIRRWLRRLGCHPTGRPGAGGSLRATRSSRSTTSPSCRSA